MCWSDAKCVEWLFHSAHSSDVAQPLSETAAAKAISVVTARTRMWNSSCRSPTWSATGWGIDVPNRGPRAVIPVRASIVPASPGAVGGTAAAAAPQSPEDCLVLTRQHMVQSPYRRVVRRRWGPIWDHSPIARCPIVRRFTPAGSDAASPPPRRSAARRGPMTSRPDRRSIPLNPLPPPLRTAPRKWPPVARRPRPSASPAHDTATQR